MTPCLGEHLEAYVEGRLGAEEADAVSAHLRLCDACRKEWAWLRTERRMLADRARRSAPHPFKLAELRRSTLKRVPQALETSHRRELRVRIARAGRALLSAGCAVLAALAVAYLPHTQAPMMVASADADCMSLETSLFCGPPTSPHERVAAVEDLFDACLVATPHAGPGATNLCW